MPQSAQEHTHRLNVPAHSTVVSCPPTERTSTTSLCEEGEPTAKGVDDQFATNPADSIEDDESEGIPIQSPVRSSLLLSSTLLVAIFLTAFTYWFALSTRYTGLIYTPRIMPMPSNPQNAIILIQLLTSLTVIVIGECFNMACESLRWSLAARGTSFLSFLVLSGATGFWGLFRLIVAQTRRGLFTSWRIFALYRFTVSYVLLMVAQFIWLLDIEPRTTYSLVYSEYGLAFVGDFNLTLGQSRPNSRIDVWNYLSNSAEVVGVSPTTCLPSSDKECRAYLLLGLEEFEWTSVDGFSASSAILKDTPCYVLEFQSALSDSRSSQGTHFAAFVSSSGASINMSMIAEGSSSDANNGYVVTAAWSFHGPDLGYPTDSDFTTMSIFKTNSTVIVDHVNGTIIGVVEVGQLVPYPANVTELFAAFIAPLKYDPFNISAVLQFQYDAKYTSNFTFEPVFFNTADLLNLSFISDAIVDSVYYALIGQGLFDVATKPQLQGFLAHALVLNSWASVNQDFVIDFVNPITILNISEVSVVIFVSLTSGVLLMCLVMLATHRRSVVPNMCLYPEVTFCGKLGEEVMGIFRGLSNATSRTVIGKFLDMRVKVGEGVDRDGRLRVLISTEDPPRLRKTVPYY